jgi:hypothetical protein
MSEKHFKKQSSSNTSLKIEGELNNKGERLILTIDTIKSLMTHYRVNKINIDGSTLSA